MKEWLETALGVEATRAFLTITMILAVGVAAILYSWAVAEIECKRRRRELDEIARRNLERHIYGPW